MINVQVLIDRLGGVQSAARKLGVSHPTVCDWRRAGRVPARRVPAVSEATGVARHVIRPDLWEALPIAPASANRNQPEVATVNDSVSAEA